jgi:predicted phosphoribosyltransferase
VVSKITLPWDTEAGYGAVAFDGSVRLNERLLPRLGLSEGEIQQGIEKTFRKVSYRAKGLRGERAFPDLSK